MGLPRCQVIPHAEHQVSWEIDRQERLRWHFGPQYPRPFLYPLRGPSGVGLTRMGHPGAPDHDHHRSIWFGHAHVQGVNFWSDTTLSRIRQQAWIAYQDGDEEAILAVRLGWFDGHDPRALIDQELLVSVQPGPEGETFVEIQSSFVPQSEMLEFGKTNFGFLAVRLARHLSCHFGGGTLTNSSGATGEAQLFGKPAAWVDASGPGHQDDWEGITYFDHPDNPGFPSAWHVREDGWLTASVCLAQPVRTTRQKPLRLRYLLHAHAGTLDRDRAHRLHEQFCSRPGLEVVKANRPHTQFLVRRKPTL